MSKTCIYLDNAATTRISDRVYNAMLPYFRESYGNPGAIYSLGREAARALKNSRLMCAKALYCEQGEIYFTSGGSESDNWAIISAAESMREQGKNRIVTSPFEHKAVLNTVKALEKRGFETVYLPVYENGVVKAEDAERVIDEKTALVTVMYVNNEICNHQPVAEIVAICRKKGVLFHTDAVQAAPHMIIDAQNDNVDYLSISGHKLHAPKGVGLLYCRKGVPLTPFVNGGAQEHGLRAGTENLASIVGLAEAMAETAENAESERNAMLLLTKKLTSALDKVKGAHLNGDRTKRIPSILNYSFEGIESESLVLQLDLKGIACAGGSACTSGSVHPSHVLMSLGMSESLARGGLRISLGRYNTEDEINIFIGELTNILEKLRKLTGF